MTRTAQAAWEKYLPAVEAFCPGIPDDEKRERAGIMLLRDLATAGLPRACPDARSVLFAVQSSAIMSATAMPADRVRDARLALVRLMTAARAMQDAFGGDSGVAPRSK